MKILNKMPTIAKFIRAGGVLLLLPFWTVGQSNANSLPNTIEKIKPSIVAIGTYQPTRRPPTSIYGTGFVVGDGSYVVTNYHVVDRDLDTERLEKLVVIEGRGRETISTEVNILAVSRQHDLAILKLNRKLPPLQLDGGTLRREGEEIAFTGFPIGSVLGLFPVTHRGMISSITPTVIPVASSRQLDIKMIKALRSPILVYQLDGTAYPGNSGSPVFDPDTGAVIAVVNMVYVKDTKEDLLSEPSGITYAIPIKYLIELLSDPSVK